MLVCQWHLDIVYGKQAEAVRIMRAWGADKFASSEFRLARGARLLLWVRTLCRGPSTGLCTGYSRIRRPLRDQSASRRLSASGSPD
jgi:hypothetical protein